MATTMAQVPVSGRRFLVAGLAGLLIGAVTSGVVTWMVQSAQVTTEVTAQAPALTREDVLSPEAIRAKSTYVAPATGALLSPEAIRAKATYVAPTSGALFSPEAIRARASSPTLAEAYAWFFDSRVEPQGIAVTGTGPALSQLDRQSERAESAVTGTGPGLAHLAELLSPEKDVFSPERIRALNG
jgi:hypothetical protein